MEATPLKIIDPNALRTEKGVPYSRTQLWRKERAGTFPQRVQLGDNRIGWYEHEIDAWLKSLPRAAEPQAA